MINAMINSEIIDKTKEYEKMKGYNIKVRNSNELNNAINEIDNYKGVILIECCLGSNEVSNECKTFVNKLDITNKCDLLQVAA